jgi:hypothetical protein
MASSRKEFTLSVSIAKTNDTKTVNVDYSIIRLGNRARPEAPANDVKIVLLDFYDVSAYYRSIKSFPLNDFYI